MGKKKRKNEEARRRRDRDRMRLRAKRIREEKAMMSVKNKLLEMTFEIDTDSFYSNGNGTDVRRFGEENSVGTRLDELNVAPYSRVIKCETDVWSSEDMCQPHDVLQHSTTLNVESEVHQMSEHDQHSNVSIKCETDVWGSEDVLECQSHVYDVCDSGATVGAESHDYPGSECDETGECCDEVSYRIFLNDDWGIHTTGENTYVCSDCDMVFSDEICLSDFKNHFELHDEGQCDKMSTNKPCLNRHEKVFISEKPFVCEDYGLEFVNKNDLVNHRKCHIGENPLMCSNFNKMFSEKEKLNEHHAGINTGQLADDLSGEKSFACSRCDEKFGHESDMPAHLGFHASEKPTVSEPCTEEPPSEQVRRETEQRNSTDSVFTFDYHEKLISKINKSVYSRESGIAIETGIDAGDLKDVSSMEPDQPVEAHSVETGTNVLGDVSSDLNQCPSQVHSQCSSNVACSEGSLENSAIDMSEKLDTRAGCEIKFSDIAIAYYQEGVHNINKRIYPCSACGMEFTKKRLMLAHRRSAHPGYKPFACKVCNKTFAHKYLLANHMGTHTRTKSFACCFCDMKFSGKNSLKSHQRIHYNENPYYTCDLCMEQFVYKAQLIRHLKKKCFFDQHRQTYTDEIPSASVCIPHMQTCSAEFEASKNNDTLVERNKSLSNLTGIKVGLNLEFKTKDVTSADESEIDGPVEEITVGPGENFDVKSDPTDLATEFKELKRSKSGIDGNMLSVDEVKKEYPDSGTEITASVHNDMLSDLSVGTRRGEPHVDRNPISNFCGTDLSVNSMSQVSDIHQSQSNAGCSTTPFETFQFINILKYPRREKTHECLRCDKKFATRVGAIAHQITHTSEKPFSCKVCDRHFSRLSYLKNHQIIHPSVKPLSCSDCGMEFRNRYKFSNHRKMKCAGDKPYPCMVCTKRFVSKGRLFDHFRSHTNERPFVCHECDKTFTQAATLKSHMKIHTIK